MTHAWLQSSCRSTLIKAIWIHKFFFSSILVLIYLSITWKNHMIILTDEEKLKSMKKFIDENLTQQRDI